MTLVVFEENQGSLLKCVWERLQIWILSLEIMTIPINTVKDQRSPPKRKPVYYLMNNTIWGITSVAQFAHWSLSNMKSLSTFCGPMAKDSSPRGLQGGHALEIHTVRRMCQLRRAGTERWRMQHSPYLELFYYFWMSPSPPSLNLQKAEENWLWFHMHFLI